MELAPTDHAAILRVTFPKRGNGNKRVCFAQAEWLRHGSTPVPWITGKSTEVHQDRMLISNFAMHIRVISEDAATAEGVGDVTCFKFKSDAHIVSVRIASSLISGDQAEVNLNREVGIERSFDEIAAEAKDVWNKMLSRVDVVDPGELTGTVSRHLSIFYTSLWRSLTFPRRIDEITKDDKMVHYSPYDPRGGVHDGPLVTDNGFWDTFRTVYPMLSLLYPDHLGIIVQGWLNAYKEGGWLPSWASPGYRNCMVGTYADVVVADAIIKNIKGFELDTALEAMKKDSFTGPPPLSGGAVGKECLNEYVDRGYISSDNPHGGETVSRTLDFGFADFAVANAMKKIQEDSTDEKIKKSLQFDIVKLEKRADRAVHSLYNGDHGLMAPKASSGGFSLRFAEKAWGNGFTEGNSWHHSFPPYALNKLASMHGSKEKLLLKLHTMLEIPSDFQVGSYGQEIHEMTEMRALAMGQYGHNNQPCHHILYLFAMLGDRETTERNVRAVIDRAYGVDFYAGDEDNGEQGAWFVLSALGLYSTVPGTPDYVLGSPIFKHVRIWRSGDNEDITKNEYLDIVALGTSDKNILVSEVQLNGNSVTLPTVQDGDLQKNGILRFIMENEKLSDGSIPEFNKYEKNNHEKEMVNYILFI
jgi:predicted alpha-1,2-mannosidase